MIKRSTLSLLIAISLIGIVVSLRILPHPDNFAPVAAAAIFGGAILSRRLAVWVPLVAMIISDAIIGFHSNILVTWGCYALIALAAGHWLRKPTIGRGIALTAGSSLFFFVVTNFAVWLRDGMYEHSWNGLVLCYTLALPFFRNTVMSDMFYTALLFGSYAMVTRLAYRTQPAKAE